MEAELSRRQRQVLEMAAEGRTDKEIARLTGLAEGTVRTYWDRMRRRYDAKSRAEVVAKALIKPGFDIGRYMLFKLPLFVWTADNSGYVDFCNEWFTTCGMLQLEDAIGIGCRALMPEEDQPAAEARWREALKTGQGYEAFAQLRCGPEGEPRNHKIRVTPLRGSDGQIVKWIGYGREMAENADELMVKFLKALVS